MTPRTSATMFRSARSASNAGLIAFAAALLTAFALHAGAFLPQLATPGQPQQLEVASSPAGQAAPAVVAGAKARVKPRG